MKTHLARDLAELESQLSDLGDLVLQSVQCAIDAISSFDLEKVAQIAQNEKLINTMEISIEHASLGHLMARLCAVVGGVFAVSGMADRWIHRAVGMMAKMS